jgi:uncharacterized membrane protein YphA (DoxX/SURF4 family)
MSNKTLWAATIVLALMLLGSGGAKLAGVPQVHQSFAVLGLPGWFGYFIGACEVLGAIVLFIRPLSALAAAGIAIIAIGAIYYHVAHTPVAQGVPALLILLLCSYVFARRRADLLSFG